MKQKTAHFIKIRVSQNIKPQKASTDSALKDGSSVQNSTLSTCPPPGSFPGLRLRPLESAGRLHTPSGLSTTSRPPQTLVNLPSVTLVNLPDLKLVNLPNPELINFFNHRSTYPVKDLPTSPYSIQPPKLKLVNLPKH